MMCYKSDIKKYNFVNINSSPDFQILTGQFLLNLSKYYPEIEQWYRTKVIPGLITGERVGNIITLDNSIVGVAIGKRAERVSKLCTVYVDPAHREMGLGNQLLNSIIPDLISYDTNNIYLTMNEETHTLYNQLFINCGFTVSGYKCDAYTKGVDEFIYTLNCKDFNKEKMYVTNRLG